MLTAITFAGSFIAGKYTIIELQPLTTAFMRYLIALLVLSIFLFRYKTVSLRVARRDWRSLALLGLFGVVGYQFFFLIALKHTAAVNTSIINAFSPIVTGLGAAVLIKERLTKANYLGILMAIFGVVILITRGNFSYLFGMNFGLGEVLMLGAVLSWAIYAILIKKLLARYSGFTLTFYAALFGVIESGLLCLIENPAAQLATISSVSLWALLYLGVVATGFGHFLYNLCIDEIGPTKTAGFVYSIVPFCVALLAYLFFKETMNIVAIFSGIFIIIGLYFMSRRMA